MYTKIYYRAKISSKFEKHNLFFDGISFEKFQHPYQKLNIKVDISCI